MHNLRGGVSSSNMLKGTISSNNTLRGSLSIGNVSTPVIDPSVVTQIIETYLEEKLTTDDSLKLEDGVLSVNTTDQMEQDNTLPITSAGVFATVGNIEALLKTI